MHDMRPNYLCCVLCCIGLLMVLAASAKRPGGWRVEHLPGSARLSVESIRTLVLPTDAGPALSAAAEDLRQLFAMCYGISLTVLEDDGSRPKHAIYLDDSGVVHARISNDEFFIHRQRTCVYIAGDGESGVINGVYAICAKLLGARWYWAGELGLELVEPAATKFPEGHWRERPAYEMRTLYPIHTDFARRNRLVRHFEFNHALAKVFTPALYEVEPALFAEVHGHRPVPSGSGASDPQPDFTQARAIQVAAEAALAAFAEDPDRRSFSLSINDNTLFDDTAATRRLIEPVEYFRGRPNYTDLVFGFMNAVAERVFESGGAWTTPSGKPRYLTALAYYWTEQSPSFQIHPRVMPVLTSDRAQWHDPAYRAADQALIRRWADSGAERLATWDYYFGAPYMYPRQFNQWIIDSLAYMSDHRVSAFFSQLPSAWGLDGGKAWLAAQLLWNPQQDAAALLDDYYTHFFGAAALPMRNFYERAEAHRTVYAGAAKWIKFYQDEAAIELFDRALLEQLRECIRLAKQRVADDPRRLARVEVVSAAFSLTEAFAHYHTTRSLLLANALDVLSTTHQGDATLLPVQLEDCLRAGMAFEELGQELVQDPMHARLHSFLKYKKMDPVPLALAAMAQAGVAMAQDTYPTHAAVVKVAERWSGDDANVHSMLSNVDLTHAASAPMPRNFLGPDLPTVPGWNFDFRPAQHLHIDALDAGAGIHLSGADVVSIFRDIPVISEQPYLFDAAMAYRISPDNRIQIRLSWSDQAGSDLGTDILFRCPTGDSNGLRRILLPIHAPQQASTLRLRFFVSRQYPGDFLNLQRVDFGLIAK